MKKTDQKRQSEYLSMFRQCESMVVRVCLFFARGDRDRFRDLYQEVARVLWEEWPRYRAEGSINAWATAIALNTAAQEWRRTHRRPDFVRLDESFYDAIADEATDERYHQLYFLIDRLDSDADRQLLYLYLDRRPLAEIATLTSCSPDAVKARLYRIKQKLINLKNRYYAET